MSKNNDNTNVTENERQGVRNGRQSPDVPQTPSAQSEETDGTEQTGGSANGNGEDSSGGIMGTDGDVHTRKSQTGSMIAAILAGASGLVFIGLAVTLYSCTDVGSAASHNDTLQMTILLVLLLLLAAVFLLVAAVMARKIGD